ncbi:MAG: hypothetical protein AAGF76_11570 [Pseudomonadota bacterium]
MSFAANRRPVPQRQDAPGTNGGDAAPTTQAQRGETEMGEIAARRRRRRDAAMALPLAGILLLFSPVMLIFDLDGTILGVPAPVAYLFIAWAGLIAAARSIGRGLAMEAETSRPRTRRPGS